MQKRRQNGEGTIYQRKNGLWVCEITLGYDADNKRIKKTLSSMDLEKLKKKINDTKYLRDRNMIAEPSNYTVQSWLEFWLETYKKNSVKPTTYDMYYGALHRYIIPNIGKYKLTALTALQVQQLINDASKKGLNKEDGLSYSSMRKILITLSQAYDKAMALNMLYVNPCAGVVIPKKQAKKSVAFTAEEQERFINCCTNHTTFENFFVFAFNTGMRMGEIMALTWDDINDDDNAITVSLNLTVVTDYDNKKKKTKTLIGTPKTGSSTRDIPLSKSARECIEYQRKNSNGIFVFASKTGTPLQKRNIYRAFNDILLKAEITSDVTVHSTRHSFATRLLESGADIKTVSELLGHKSIQITLDTYSHVSGNLKNKTIALLDK